MKLVYKNMGHILKFDDGFVNELIIENKKMFFNFVNSLAIQADGYSGDCVLSVSDKPVELSKYAELIVQFAPFQLNRKSLLTKLYTLLEKNALSSENCQKAGELLAEAERYMYRISEDFSFEISCKKLSIGSIIRALAPEIEEDGKEPIEKVFSYIELVRELERDKLFIMVNMRSYFSYEEMERFIESVIFHDFKVLLLESFELPKLNHTKRYIVDNDLCEI